MSVSNVDTILLLQAAVPVQQVPHLVTKILACSVATCKNIGAQPSSKSSRFWFILDPPRLWFISLRLQRLTSAFPTFHLPTFKCWGRTTSNKLIALKISTFLSSTEMLPLMHREPIFLTNRVDTTQFFAQTLLINLVSISIRMMKFCNGWTTRFPSSTQISSLTLTCSLISMKHYV